MVVSWWIACVLVAAHANISKLMHTVNTNIHLHLI